MEGENAPETENVHENATTATETPTATTPDQTNNKRQSILSKLFGGGANKKKEEEAAHEETTGINNISLYTSFALPLKFYYI